VTRKLHSNEAVVRSHNPSINVQRKRGNVAKHDRPLDQNCDRSIRRYFVFGRYQHAVAANGSPSGLFHLHRFACQPCDGHQVRWESEFGGYVPGDRNYSSLALLVSSVENQDKFIFAAGYIFHGCCTRNIHPIRPKHDAGVQGNRFAYFDVDPSTRKINAASHRASNFPSFVEPRQSEWFFGWDAPINALEFLHRRLHLSGQPSTESGKRYE
jgi:hypothetical protein